MNPRVTLYLGHCSRLGFVSSSLSPLSLPPCYQTIISTSTRSRTDACSPHSTRTTTPSRVWPRPPPPLRSHPLSLRRRRIRHRRVSYRVRGTRPCACGTVAATHRRRPHLTCVGSRCRPTANTQVRGSETRHSQHRKRERIVSITILTVISRFPPRNQNPKCVSSG